MEGMMLKLKLQYFGHLMRRVDSLEKTLMLGGIGGRRKRGWQRTRWLDGITESMEVCLSAQDWGPSALRVSWCFVPLFFVPRGQGSPILGDLGAFVSSGMAAKEIWVCAGWGHRWWSFRGCLTSVAAAALHLILVEVDGKCLCVSENIHMNLCLFF